MAPALHLAKTASSGLDRPDRPTLLRWTAGVLAAHLGLITGIAGTLDWRLPSPALIRTAPMQTRWVAAPQAQQARAPAPATPAPAKTRVAQVKQAPAAAPPPAPAPAPSSEPDPVTSAQPELADINATAPTEEASATDSATAPSPQASDAPAVVMANAADANGPPPPPDGQALPSSTTLSPESAKAPAVPSSAPQTPQDAPPAPNGLIANATAALPSVSLAALPPSVLMSYRLNGQEKGIQYTASGQLRWQHNHTAYEMSLSIKAFLLGSRHWRSLGDITSAGLAPTKFSDSWRSERAAHFDRTDHRIVFSSNAPTVPLQPGAQDQISLYVQLAAAMAGSGQKLQPGTRLQIQTATVRDAVPWLLTLDQIETLTVDGQSVQATKWVCQPRNRFDAKVEFWVAAEHAWLPSRIRITQVSGNFIDLNLTGQEPLPPLPTQAAPLSKTPHS